MGPFPLSAFGRGQQRHGRKRLFARLRHLLAQEHFILKKAIIILAIFFAGFYFGSIAIDAAKLAYKVVAEEIHNASR
jgi:hypothetical protein